MTVVVDKKCNPVEPFGPAHLALSLGLSFPNLVIALTLSQSEAKYRQLLGQR